MDIFSRQEKLVGSEGMERLGDANEKDNLLINRCYKIRKQ